MSLKDIGVFEVVLAETILFTALWLIDEYTASLLTFIFVPIFGFIFIISLISEWLERSKVPRKYFLLMGVSIFIPLLVFVVIKYLFGTIDW